MHIVIKFSVDIKKNTDCIGKKSTLPMAFNLHNFSTADIKRIFPIDIFEHCDAMKEKTVWFSVNL